MGNKKIIITIVILALLVIGLSSFIVYDKFFANSKEDDTLTQIGEVSIDLNDIYTVGEKLEMLDNAFGDPNSNYVGYLYSKKKIDVKSMDYNAALYVALYDELIRNNAYQLLSGTRVKYNLNMLFGNSISYQGTQLNAGNQYNFLYDSATDRYGYTVAPEVAYSPELMVANVKTTLGEEKIIIDRKPFFVEYVLDQTGTEYKTANIYKDASKSNKVGTINLTKQKIDKDEIIGKLGSKLDTYRYTFKEKSAGKYYFDSIEKIK